jgi:hypothetical protein
MPVNETSGEGARGFTYTVAITRRSNQSTEDAETASYNEASESWTVSAATAEAIRGLIEQAAGGDEPTWDPEGQPDDPQSQLSTARGGTSTAGQATSITEGGVETEG